MGAVYPQIQIPDSAINTVLKIVEDIKATFPPDKQRNLTHRPMRPNEIQTTFTTETRVYHHKASATTFQNILRDGTNVANITVPTGSAFVLFGWIFIENLETPLGFNGVARIKVNGVIKNEVSTKLIDVQPNKMLLTLDQIVVAEQQSILELQVKGSSSADNIIIYPLGYRIGPKNQLDVT